MNSILKEFYYGNVNPTERQRDQNPEYDRAFERVMKIEEDLLDLLGEDEKSLFKKYSAALAEASCEECAQTFTDGFRLGAAFIFDTFEGR